MRMLSIGVGDSDLKPFVILRSKIVDFQIGAVPDLSGGSSLDLLNLR